LDDTQPSKLMRLLSSNEDETVMLSSPGHFLPAPLNTSCTKNNTCIKIMHIWGLMCNFYLLVSLETC